MINLHNFALVCMILFGKTSSISLINLRNVFFLLALHRAADGLICYSCSGCSGAVNKNDTDTKTVPNNQGYSCVVSLWMLTLEIVF